MSVIPALAGDNHAAAVANSTILVLQGNDYNWGKPQLASHTWMEPLAVILIMLASMYCNRMHSYSILPPSWRRGHGCEMTHTPRDSFDHSRPTSPDLFAEDGDTHLDSYTLPTNYSLSKQCPSKTRYCCGLQVHTPNSSRFENHLHSRVIQKFPFLVEMFYWIINFAFYSLSRTVCQKTFDAENVWNVAQHHAESILHFEHASWASFIFPLSEVDFQRWFMNRHIGALTFLNRAYSLFHIPGTVAFIGWYYFAAPTHAHFAVVRRTMTLSNAIAFVIFTFYPVMPPRLFPARYGFVDTVHRDQAESVWQRGSYVNSLGAMPSLHFVYASFIGAVALWHGLVTCDRWSRSNSSSSFTLALRRLPYVLVGVGYPLMVLTAIIATANHFWADVVAALCVIAVAFLGNTVLISLLPVEDLLLWMLRLEKPVPTTGASWKEVRD